MRDVPNHADYWTIQVLAGYEGRDDQDLDGEPNAKLGMTSSTVESPVHIFLETIRDASVNFPGAVDSERLRQRTVLHEVMHKFGYAAHDVAVMDPDLAMSGLDSEVELVGVLLRKLHINNPKK